LFQQGIKTKSLLHIKKHPRDLDNIVCGDLVSGKGLDQFLTGMQTVVHLVGRFEPPFEQQLKLNTLAFNNLCKYVVKQNVAKIIFVSAAAAYGSAQRGKYFSEKDKLLPNTHYGLSKKLGEEVAWFFHRKYGLQVIILRPPNIYGPGSDHGVIFNFLQSIKKTGRVVIYGDGKQERDFLYVDDMVEAILEAISYKASDAFNIGSGDTVSLIDVVGLLEEILDRKILVEYKDSQPFVVRRLAVQINKAKKLLHWKPMVSLKEGLKKTVYQIDL
jgi:UDP-glucose 4-epimerase